MLKVPLKSKHSQYVPKIQYMFPCFFKYSYTVKKKTQSKQIKPTKINNKSIMLLEILASRIPGQAAE